MKSLILALVVLVSLNVWSDEDTQLIGKPVDPATQVVPPGEMPEPIKKTENPKGTIVKPTKEQLKSAKKIKKSATDAASKPTPTAVSTDPSNGKK